MVAGGTERATLGLAETFRVRLVKVEVGIGRDGSVGDEFIRRRGVPA